MNCCLYNLLRDIWNSELYDNVYITYFKNTIDVDIYMRNVRSVFLEEWL
jgi:hypothetical protein